VKPVSKGGHHCRLDTDALDRFRLADSATDELPMKELHSETGVVADLPSLEMSAPATPQMAAKGTKRGGVDVREHATLPLDEAAEMGSGSEVSNRTGRSVSITFQVVGECVDVGSTDSTAQAPQGLGSGEVLL
jgi:hypothetical protein